MATVMNEANANPGGNGKIDWLARTQELLKRVAEAKEEREILRERLEMLRESAARADEKLKASMLALAVALKGETRARRASAGGGAKGAFRPRRDGAAVPVMRYLLSHPGPQKVRSMLESGASSSAIYGALEYLSEHKMAQQNNLGWKLTLDGEKWIEANNPGLPPTR